MLLNLSYRNEESIRERNVQAAEKTMQLWTVAFGIMSFIRRSAAAQASPQGKIVNPDAHKEAKRLMEAWQFKLDDEALIAAMRWAYADAVKVLVDKVSKQFGRGKEQRIADIKACARAIEARSK